MQVRTHTSRANDVTMTRSVAQEERVSSGKEASTSSEPPGASKPPEIVLQGLPDKAARTAVHLMFKGDTGLPRLVTDTVSTGPDEQGIRVMTQADLQASATTPCAPPLHSQASASREYDVVTRGSSPSNIPNTICGRIGAMLRRSVQRKHGAAGRQAGGSRAAEARAAGGGRGRAGPVKLGGRRRSAHVLCASQN